MPNIAQRIAELGITLPPVTAAAGNYIGASRWGTCSSSAATGLISATASTSVARSDAMTVDEGIAAARATALCILATMDANRRARPCEAHREGLGDGQHRPRLQQHARVDQRRLRPVRRDRGEAAGKHARSAVGLAELPFDIAVEIELSPRSTDPWGNLRARAAWWRGRPLSLSARNFGHTTVGCASGAEDARDESRAYPRRRSRSRGRRAPRTSRCSPRCSSGCST